MVLSRTYQMASEASEASEEADPQNVLLSRMPIRRLEGEVIRDALLAVSGGLDPEAFGPSVPTFVTEFMQGRGRPESSGPLDGNGRRSLYLEVRRNFLSPIMLAFDQPIPFSTVGRRNTSNVPAQALILMNDPFVVEQANKWAQRLLGTGRPADALIEEMFRDAFGRMPTYAELQDCKEFLDQQSGEHRGEERIGNYDSRAWSDLAHVLFNAKEFIYLK
jgi:hypothetical protein